MDRERDIKTYVQGILAQQTRADGVKCTGPGESIYHHPSLLS
jgi:hypothetical protein